MVTSGDDGSSSSEDSSLCFLPVVTIRSNSRRDVELMRSSARSHLAKTMHRKKQFKTGKSKVADDTKKSALGESGSVIYPSLDPRKLVRYQQVTDMTVDQHTSMLLHYSRTCFWPGFGIGAATFHIPPFALSYGGLVAQGPALYHAILWQSAVNLNFNRDSRVTDVGSIKHYNQALSHIARNIDKPVCEIGEDTMYAILSLVGPEFSFNGQKIRATRAFDPPLSKLTWINAFGRQPLTDMHADALFRLVDMKGGIDNLVSSGFRADLNCMDLIRSTQKLKRPYFHVSSIYQEVIGEHSRQRFFGHTSDFRASGSNEGASAEVDRLARLGLPEEIFQVMLDMRVWVRVLEAYQNRRLANPDLSLIGSHRDLIQHRLLSTLPEPNKFRSKMASQFDLGDLVQTGLLIFSLGVTFPITYEVPHQLTSQRLKVQLDRDFHLLMRLGLHDMMLWLGMLVALCAEQIGDGELGSWCTGFLCDVEGIRCKGYLSEDGNPAPRSWQEVRDHSLAPFLWSSVACDYAGGSIWGQVQGLSRRPVQGSTTIM